MCGGVQVVCVVCVCVWEVSIGDVCVWMWVLSNPISPSSLVCSPALKLSLTLSQSRSVTISPRSTHTHIRSLTHSLTHARTHTQFLGYTYSEGAVAIITGGYADIEEFYF